MVIAYTAADWPSLQAAVDAAVRSGESRADYGAKRERGREGTEEDFTMYM